MSTLTTAPLAPLLDRLFEKDASASPNASSAVADLSAEERARLMRSKTDYLDFFIVADNADDSPDYLARVRSPEAGYMSTPFGEDVELSMRIS